MKMNKKLTQAISLFTVALLLISYTPPVFSSENDQLSEEESVVENEDLVIKTETSTTQESIEEELIPEETFENDLINENANSVLVEAPATSEEILEESTEFSSVSTDVAPESTTDTSVEISSEENSSPSISEETAASSEGSHLPETSSPPIVETTETTTDLSNESNALDSSDSAALTPEQTAPPASSDNPIEEKNTTEESLGNQEENNSKESHEEIKPNGMNPAQKTYPSLNVNIATQLLAREFVASDLNGFELPNLSFYQTRQQAAIVYASLKLLSQPYNVLNEEGKGFDQLGFIQFIYNKVFGLAINKDFDDLQTIGEKINLAEIQIGDLLVWEKEQKMAIYLGQNKFIMADDTLLNEQLENEERTEENLAKIPGVRIFTLHMEQLEDETMYDQDLLTRYDFVQMPSYAIQLNPKLSLSAYGEEQIANYPVTFNFQKNEQTLAFIDLISESARELGLKYDLFASVLIAQAILESGSGTSGLARYPYYNLFGIKGGLGVASVMLPTQEDDGTGNLFTISSAFRVYPTYEDSLADYVTLIRNGLSSNTSFYQKVWRSNAKNYLQATSELTGKYATDTSYYNKLNSIIATYHLTQFDEPKVEVGQMLYDINQVPAIYRERMIFPTFNGQNYNTSASYGMDQCTWYVFNRVAQLGGKVGDYMGNGADWKETGIAQGYQTVTTPKAGYVISFKQGVAGYHPLYGHVAFVEAVTDEGILISEGDASYLSYRVIPNEIALSSGVGYLIPN